MTKILITGAGSFVGSNFKKYSRYKAVSEISLLNNKPEEIEYAGFDIVLHLAAIVHQSSKIDESEYFRVNRDLCLDVALASKRAGIKQFIFLSTLKVYGTFTTGSDLRNEMSECLPDDAYGKSKYAAECGLLKLQDKDFTVSIIRTPLVYGEGVKANMLNLVKMVDYLPVLPFDKIANKRNFTFAENLIGFIDRIIEKKAAGIFIAMDETSISTSDLIRYISDSLDKRSRFIRMPEVLRKMCFRFFPETMDRLYNSLEFDNSKTKKVLEYKPPFTTREGIRKMTEFYIAGKNKT